MPKLNYKIVILIGAIVAGIGLWFSWSGYHNTDLAYNMARNPDLNLIDTTNDGQQLGADELYRMGGN